MDRLRFSKGSERLEGMKMAKRLLQDIQPPKTFKGGSIQPIHVPSRPIFADDVYTVEDPLPTVLIHKPHTVHKYPVHRSALTDLFGKKLSSPPRYRLPDVNVQLCSPIYKQKILGKEKIGIFPNGLTLHRLSGSLFGDIRVDFTCSR